MAPQQYVADIKAKLVASAAVATITIVEERLLPDRGYFRARLTLSNSDFLEVAEYFVVEAGRCMPRRYRYQWMDGAQYRLRRRWDNVDEDCRRRVVTGFQGQGCDIGGGLVCGVALGPERGGPDSAGRDVHRLQNREALRHGLSRLDL